MRNVARWLWVAPLLLSGCAVWPWLEAAVVTPFVPKPTPLPPSRYTVSTLASDGCEFPQGVAADASGDVYVSAGNQVLKVLPGGKVTVLAGETRSGYMDGPGAFAQFDEPGDLAVNASGDVFVADVRNGRIREINPDGTVSTFAGSGNPGDANGATGSAGFDDAVGIAIDPEGEVFVSEGLGGSVDNDIRKIVGGMVSTYAGAGPAGFADGPANTAKFDQPHGLAIAPDGSLLVADTNNQRIRKITPDGQVVTIAGDGQQGNKFGAALSAELDSPEGIAADSAGDVFFSEDGNNTLNEILEVQEGNVSLIAGGRAAGSKDGPGLQSDFFFPDQVALLGQDLLVADAGNDRIRKLTPS